MNDTQQLTGWKLVAKNLCVAADNTKTIMHNVKECAAHATAGTARFGSALVGTLPIITMGVLGVWATEIAIGHISPNMPAEKRDLVDMVAYVPVNGAIMAVSTAVFAVAENYLDNHEFKMQPLKPFIKGPAKSGFSNGGLTITGLSKFMPAG